MLTRIFKSALSSISPLFTAPTFMFASKKQTKKDKKDKKKSKEAGKKVEKKQQTVVSTEALKIDDANTFYRNIIRKVRVNYRGRGRFTSAQMLQLIQTCKKPEQEALMFQAYYNLLGHYTIMPNRLVDMMIQKIFALQGKYDNVLQVYENHSFLSYFPAYRTTLKLLDLVQVNQEDYSKLLNIFNTNPLIKIDKEIALNLIKSIGKEQVSTENAVKVIKLVLRRYRQNIIDQITAEEILSGIGSSIRTRVEKGQIKGTNTSYEAVGFIKEIESIQNPSEEILLNLSILFLIFNNPKSAVKIVKSLSKSQIQVFLTIAQKSVLKLQNAVKANLLDFTCDADLKNRIQNLRDNSQSESGQSKAQAS